MRMFIEHLKAGTVPHDMVEEFRKSEVQFYDGWLIVRVVDHCTIKTSANGAGNPTDDGKPFSIHNYNQYITPSPYAAYPTKEQIGQRSPQIKQDPQNKENQSSDARSDDTITAQPKSNKPKPKVYHVALRPTNLSRQMDLALDALAPDPKSINRKQSQANVNSRGGAPPTPISGVPSTPGIERGPPLKKPKLKIDAKDLLEYEARVINATAPPLYLEVPESYEEAETLVAMLRDPLHDAPPPTAKSRKRTFAELAADDAQAKESERFMLIMDERNPNNSVGTNAAAADAQAGAGIFQPRFEKFNALENIKREIAERKQRDKDRQMQEDEARRGMQAEEDRRQQQMMRQREVQQHRLRQQTEMQQRAHQQAAQQVAAQNHRQQQQQQASSIPPAMQNQMMQAQPRSSPVLRQGTPHAASSPGVNNPQIAQSQQGAGSPPRSGSAVPHGHPGVPMARGPSAQGPSRNGTPQIPHSTPGMRNATPIMRQGTPGQHMTQASPHGSMMAPTPQMQAAAMQGQGQGVMQQQQFTQQQINALQQRQAQMQAAAQMRGQPMGNGQLNPAQVAQMHAQQQLQQRDAAMRNLQQQHMLQQQQQQQQQGTPHQMQSPAHPNNQNQYKAQMQEHSRAQISALQQGQPQGSPAPQHMTPQQQAAQMAHQQQQQQQRMMQQTPQQHHNGMVPQQLSQQQMQAQAQAQQQQRPQLSGQFQHMYQTALRSYQQQYMQQAAQRYGGNTQLLQPQDLQSAAKMAHDAALRDVNQKRRQVMATAHLRQQQAQAQQNGMMGMQGMNVNMNVPQGQGQGQPGQGQQGGGGGNMQAQQAMQQQAAVNMQNMQMAQAAQMMAQAQHHGNGNGNGGGGGGGGGGSGNQASMASIAQYQQQLQQMQQQRQG